MSEFLQLQVYVLSLSLFLQSVWHSKCLPYGLDEQMDNEITDAHEEEENNS